MTNTNWKYSIQVLRKDYSLMFETSEDTPLTREQAEFVFNRMNVVFHFADGLRVRIKRFKPVLVEYADSFDKWDE